jgi:hypothetical protein
MNSMFKSTKQPPQVGDLIRSSMGTKIHLVLAVGQVGGATVVRSTLIGSFNKGVFTNHPRGLFVNATALLEVKLTPRSGWHVVVPGPGCPANGLAALKARQFLAANTGPWTDEHQAAFDLVRKA